MSSLRRPALEGSVAVREDRRLSFAEYGSTRGPAIVWMHGTPGARRQIPLEARAYAEQHGLRIVDWTRDLKIMLDVLGIDTLRLIGLSGGAP
jgi:pimeloyl-ACP methyl ester carboxylesterase